MNRLLRIISTSTALLLLSSAAFAHGRGDWSVNLGMPLYASPLVIYSAPAFVPDPPVAHVRPCGHGRHHWKERGWHKRHWHECHWRERRVHEWRHRHGHPGR